MIHHDRCDNCAIGGYFMDSQGKQLNAGKCPVRDFSTFDELIAEDESVIDDHELTEVIDVLNGLSGSDLEIITALIGCRSFINPESDLSKIYLNLPCVPLAQDVL